MSVLNADLSLSKLRASRDEWDRTMAEEVEGGIRRPRVVTLHGGEYLFRFASTSRPSTVWAVSPWWIHERDYGRILAGREPSESLGLAGRVALSIQPSWSRADVVVKARVLRPVNAFCGPARTQHRDLLANGMYLTLPGSRSIEQLYIPGLCDREGKPTPAFNQILRVMRQKRVSSFSFA